MRNRVWASVLHLLLLALAQNPEPLYAQTPKQSQSPQLPDAEQQLARLTRQKFATEEAREEAISQLAGRLADVLIYLHRPHEAYQLTFQVLRELRDSGVQAPVREIELLGDLSRFAANRSERYRHLQERQTMIEQHLPLVDADTAFDQRKRIAGLKEDVIQASKYGAVDLRLDLVVELARKAWADHEAVLLSQVETLLKADDASDQRRRDAVSAVYDLYFYLRPSSACQSAPNFDPVSASNFDPLERRVLAVALAPSELVGVAETVRARVVV